MHAATLNQKTRLVSKSIDRAWPVECCRLDQIPTILAKSNKKYYYYSTIPCNSRSTVPMNKPHKKEEIVTFKVNESLARQLNAIPNRSDFIRRAILLALESTCPLCQGTGVLTSEQKKHWKEFARNHTVTECNRCHAVHLTCEKNWKYVSRKDTYSYHFWLPKGNTSCRQGQNLWKKSYLQLSYSCWWPGFSLLPVILK